jgi:hypothetical protein
MQPGVERAEVEPDPWKRWDRNESRRNNEFKCLSEACVLMTRVLGFRWCAPSPRVIGKRHSTAKEFVVRPNRVSVFGRRRGMHHSPPCRVSLLCCIV